MSASIPAHIAQTLLDLRARRDFLSTAIDVLSQIWEGTTPPVAEAPAVPPAEPVRSVPAPVDRRATLRQPDEDGITADAEAVLKVLRHAKQPMKPCDIFEAAKIDPERGDKAKHVLLRRNRIVVSGLARASRWSLPAGAPAPKEGL